jgi:hypothetical protein
MLVLILGYARLRDAVKREVLAPPVP